MYARVSHVSNLETCYGRIELGTNRTPLKRATRLVRKTPRKSTRFKINGRARIHVCLSLQFLSFDFLRTPGNTHDEWYSVQQHQALADVASHCNPLAQPETLCDGAESWWVLNPNTGRDRCKRKDAATGCSGELSARRQTGTPW